MHIPLWYAGYFLALIAPMVPVAYLVIVRLRKGEWHKPRLFWVISLLATLAINPIVQIPLLEPYDTAANERWSSRAEAADLLGKTRDEVRNELGDPLFMSQENSRILDSNGREARAFEPYELWEYKPLPGYWLGSHFQVVFKNGRASAFEANDD